MIGAVHQFVSSFVPHDAVSAHAVHLRALLRDMGLESEIYVKETRGEVRGEAHFYRAYRGSPGGALLLYQAATGSKVAEFLLERPEPKVVNYHNLTPPRFFAPWEPHSAVELSVGLRQMADLAPATALAIAVSRTNEDDLRGLGYEHTTVAPVLVDLHRFERQPDEASLERLTAEKSGGGTDILFVGRLAPNKAQHDLVKALDAYRRLYDPLARLHLVGAPASDRYRQAVEALASAAGLEAAVNMPGSVSDGALASYFGTADVFVCLSEHEGFCIPLLEAMHHGVPIVALSAGAVPETIAGAGIVLPDKDPATVSAAIHRVVTDTALRERLMSAGRARLAEFALDRTRDLYQRAIGELLAL